MEHWSGLYRLQLPAPPGFEVWSIRPVCAMTDPMRIRELHSDEWMAVAELIHVSTNAWYEANLNRSIFQRDDASGCLVFPEVYEALDPGCCLVAEEEDGRLMGSCFYHPRETHVSLGIMNAHPDFAGRGVARALLSCQGGATPCRGTAPTRCSPPRAPAPPPTTERRQARAGAAACFA